MENLSVLIMKNLDNNNEFKMLAVDIGASSGRVIEAVYSNHRLKFNEIHRFKNSVVELDGSFYWDHEMIFSNILEGISKVDNINSIGIDTWGVDYVLVNDKEIKYGYSYRDNRTLDYYNSDDKYSRFISTGVACLPFSTVYQLEVEKLSGVMLMVPDYYIYKLTGKLSNEWTNFKTTQILDTNGDICYVKDGVIYNEVTKLKTFEVPNSNTVVTQVASHDTASAFLGSLYYDEGIIISFGTWSIIGVVTDDIIITDDAYYYGFSNEGSIFDDNRFVTNSMGSWMLERVLGELNNTLDYDELIQEVSKCYYSHQINVDDIRFINPPNFVDEINKYLEERDLDKPNDVVEYTKLILDSMVVKHATIITNIEQICGKTYDTINIIGGGSQNKYFASQIAKNTNKKVVLGPIEATVVGNVLCQLLGNNIIERSDFKTIISNSNLILED